MKYEIRVNGVWVGVSVVVFRSWSGRRRVNGVEFRGPIFYYLTTQEVTR